MNILSIIKKVFCRKGNFTLSLIPYTLYLILAASLLSCSEDLDVSNGIIKTINEDYITVDILIPQEKYIDTRADNLDPNQINELAVFIYNGDSFVQKSSLTGDKIIPNGENQYKVIVEKNADAKKAESLNFYAIANPGRSLDELSESPTILKIQNVVASDYCSTDGFYMAGKAVVSSNTTVELTRAAGKITVKNQTADDKFELTGFHIYGTANDCYVSAGETTTIKEGNKNYNDSDKGFINKENEPYTQIGYAMPTYTHKLVEGKDPVIYTYIVLEGRFNGENGFYALPLYSQSKDKHYDIKPNYWYELVLEEINHPGQGTRDEAIANPCDYVIYDIHEHTPNILSMASDGVHELGVTHDIELQPSTENLGASFDVYSNTFIVKIYSAKTEETLNFDDVEFEINSGGDWMEVDFENGTKIEADDSLSDEDKSLFGIQYWFTVSNKSERYTPQTGTIKVTWKGLERDINISYNPTFQMDKACTGTLYIYDDTNASPKYTIQKYWAFLQGDNEDWKLYGVGNNDMAENKIRNQGFHFPMPYGNDVSNKTWTYEYDVNFNALQEQLGGEGITGITATISGNNYFTGGNLEWTYNSNNLTGHLKLNNPTPDNYDYATGRIVFTVNYGENSTRAFTLNLYHTGFFHHDDGFDYEGDTKITYMEPNEFYYYEVVPMEDGYWLDRNLGAKSNKMFIEDGSTDGLGNSDAKGRYFKICKYVEGSYKEPYVINDMCPPGYHIPVSSEWNSIRLSAHFQANQETDEKNQSYSATYYQSSIGKVYFPRAKYYHSDNNSMITWSQEKGEQGDASTGYYWTATEAPGMEKLEMGKWLRGLYLNGANTTYQNMDVVTSKLNVRCVAGKSIPSQDNHYISINVHNATHVYLFDKTSGNALYTFPGKAVGTEASSQRWQYFSCTTSAEVSNLGMIFIKESIDGGITIFTKNGNSFDINNDFLTQTVKDATSNSSKYWEIEGGKFYDFCYEKEVEGQDPIDLIQKRKENNISNISDKQPSDDYCSYDENAQSSNSGTAPTYEFEKEYDEEVAFRITQSSITGSEWGNNQDLASGNLWNNLKVGDTIKVYFHQEDGELIVQTYAGWDNRLGEYRIGNMHQSIKNSSIYVLNIEVTDYLLSMIKSNGLIFNGTHFTLVGVTILPGDGTGTETKPFEPDYPEKEDILWSGDFVFSGWNSFDFINNTSYFDKLKEGSYIKIYNEYINGNGFKIYYVGNEWYNFGEDPYKPVNNTTVSIPLTSDLVSKIKSSRGLILNGDGYRIKAITIYTP